MFKSEIKTVLFYVILIFVMISLFSDYDMVILKTFTFTSHYIYRMNLYIVLPLLHNRFYSPLNVFDIELQINIIIIKH